MTTQQSAFQQAYTFISQGVAAKLYREQGQWVCLPTSDTPCVPMYNTKQMIELEMLK
jgi:hypothetical protein